MVPCKSPAEEVSIEWLHRTISSTDSKDRTTLHVSIIDSGSETVVVTPFTSKEKTQCMISCDD